MSTFLLRNLLILATLAFVAFIALSDKQDRKLNWSLFYAALYTTIALAIVNFLCVQQEYWFFKEARLNALAIPFDIYFVWIIFWGLLPFYLLKGKWPVIIGLLLFLFDVTLMPVLEKINLLQLNENWWIGEALLIIFVFLPAYYWAKFNYENKFKSLRALFQVLCMMGVFFVGLPFIAYHYGLQDTLNYKFSPWQFQILLILAFPGLVATYDLVQKGEGTPFPYDPTKHLVRTGIYAYCRNPIQWSFTFVFIPLSIYHQNPWLLLGSIFSVAYAFGVSDYQEYPDMEKRFGEKWKAYKSTVPKWRFLWRPKNIPLGKIYFDPGCTPCHQLKSWFEKSKRSHLEVLSSTKFPGTGFLQATYVDHMGREYKSVGAIAQAFNHLHLGYATLGWFMDFPVINYLLQAIVNGVGYGKREEDCTLEKRDK